MADDLPPANISSADEGAPNIVTNASGGVNLSAQHNINIDGDAVGRDKVTNNIDTGGGAYVAGNVTVASGGEFVGRDKITVIPRDKNLRILMEKVKTFWVEGVLENSVHHAALLELGKQVKADAVEADHPWETIVRTADKPDYTLPPNEKIIDVFDEMKGALWLVDELRAKYGVPDKMGSRWIEDNDLILLLDGLDAVKSEHRTACVDAINKFHLEHGLTSMVVCSRTREYEELASQLKLNGAVLIQPLTRKQIDHYIAAGGSQLAALGKAMQADVVLQELAEVPLTLSIMSLAYSGQSADHLTSILDDPAQRQKHLFSAYVDKMFDRIARTT